MKGLIIALILTALTTAGTMNLDYTAAKKLLFENNRDILIAAQGVIDAEGKLTDASSGYLPKISLYGSYNYISSVPAMQISLPVGPSVINKTIQTGQNDNWVFRAALSQVLFDWGRMFLAPKTAAKGLETAELELEQVKAQALLNLNQVFYSVILSKKIVEVNEESLKLAEENAKLASARLNTGAGSSFDLLRAKVRISSMKPVVSKSRNIYEMSVQSLKNILGIMLTEEINITGELINSQAGDFGPENTALDAALKKALKDRVEIKKSVARKEIAEASLALISTGDKPFLTGSLSYNYQNPYYTQLSWVDSWNAGLVLSIPVFDGFSTAGKSRSAEAAVKSTEITKIQIENLIELEVKQTVLNLNEVSERILAQSEVVKQAEEYYKIAEASYKSGVNTNYDVMDAHLGLLTAKTAYLQALYDLALAKASYLKAIGELK